MHEFPFTHFVRQTTNIGQDVPKIASIMENLTVKSPAL